MFSCGLINQVEDLLSGLNDSLDNLTPDQIALSGLVIDPPVEGALISLRNITNADDSIPIIRGDTTTGSDGSFSIVFSTTNITNMSSYYEVVATGGTDTSTGEVLDGLSLTLPVEIGELVTNRGTGRRADLAVTPITSLLTAEIFTNLMANPMVVPRLADIKERVSGLLNFGSSEDDIDRLFGNPLMNANVLKTSLYLGKIANLATDNKKPDSFKNILKVLGMGNVRMQIQAGGGNGAGLENFLADENNLGNFMTEVGFVNNGIDNFRRDFEVYRGTDFSDIDFSRDGEAEKISKKILQNRIRGTFFPLLTNEMVVKDYIQSNQTNMNTPEQQANVVKLTNGLRLLAEAISRAGDRFDPRDFMRVPMDDVTNSFTNDGVTNSFTNDGVPSFLTNDIIDINNLDALIRMNPNFSPLSTATNFTAVNLVFIGDNASPQDQQQRRTRLVALLRELRAVLGRFGGLQLVSSGEETRIANEIIP